MQIVLTGYIRPAYLTFGIELGTDSPDEAIDNVVAAWSAGSTTLKSKLDSNATVTQILLRSVVGAGILEQRVRNPNIAGTRIEQSTPPNLAILVHKRSLQSGRRGRGRWFLPWFIANSWIDEKGVVDGTQMTNLNNALTGFLTSLSGAGTPMMILHSVSEPGVDNPTLPGNPTQVTSLVCDSIVSTQRRRIGR